MLSPQSLSTCRTTHMSKHGIILFQNTPEPQHAADCVTQALDCVLTNQWVKSQLLSIFVYLHIVLWVLLFYHDVSSTLKDIRLVCLLLCSCFLSLNVKFRVNMTNKKSYFYLKILKPFLNIFSQTTTSYIY